MKLIQYAKELVVCYKTVGVVFALGKLLKLTKMIREQ